MPASGEANGSHSCTSGSGHTRDGILDDDAIIRIEPHLRRSKQEYIRRGLRALDLTYREDIWSARLRIPVRSRLLAKGVNSVDDATHTSCP